jgi:hypothetical protein
MCEIQPEQTGTTLKSLGKSRLFQPEQTGFVPVSKSVKTLTGSTSYRFVPVGFGKNGERGDVDHRKLGGMGVSRDNA